MLDKISSFIHRKGIGLGIVIPFSFLLSLFIAFQSIKPFQESLNQPQMQSLIELVATPKIDKDAIKEKLNIQKPTENDYVLSVMAEVLFTLHDKGIVGHFSSNQLQTLLYKAFYLQSILLSFVITFLAILYFLFLYIILKIIGPLFYSDLQKNAWGRLLSLVWSLILLFYVISLQFHLRFSLFYLSIIALLTCLIIAVRLKKEN